MHDTYRLLFHESSVQMTREVALHLSVSHHDD